MTSPNINVIILLGTVLGYISVVLLGLDVTIVGDVDLDTVVQVRHERFNDTHVTKPAIERLQGTREVRATTRALANISH